jgi:signal transduction histidine kinase/CheY-like chemotaxis protein
MVVGSNVDGKIRTVDTTEPPRKAAAGWIARPTRLHILIFLAGLASGEDVVSLEQAASRGGADFAAVYEGRTVTVRAQIAAPPIWAFGMYYLPVRDASEHGLILRGEHDRFASYEPGDWIEARGKIESRAGLPLLVPDSMERVQQGPPPSAKSMLLSDAASLRNLGLLVETSGTVTRVGENTGGTTLQLSDRGATAVAFLPRSPSTANDLLARIHVGDRVKATGLVTQYAPRAPYNGDFQIMLASPGDLKVSGTETGLAPALVFAVLGASALIFGLWWFRERRIREQHATMRTFHALCEEIIAAPSPAGIAEMLMTVLPSITQATGAWLYILNRRTKSLERVPTEADPEPMVVPIETPENEELVNGAVVCFQDRKQLNIPDVRRSQYLNTRTKQNSPRSAMIVPLSTQGDVLGVLEAGNANRLGYFSIEEQASIQHLANQVATALKLQEQRAMREQLFRSEKLAATGQLISGVANELRAPLEVILHLSLQMAATLANHDNEVAPVGDLRLLAGESRRASEIVARLVSFAHPEDSEVRPFDVNALLAGLVKFREPEWKALGLRLQNRLAPEPAFVLGAQGQMEQVFLNLLVHAEQSVAEVPSKTVSVGTGVIAGRVMVEIGYSSTGEEHSGLDGMDADPFSANSATGAAGALSLSVCRSIVNNHGGVMRFNTRTGTAWFEVDLPVVVRTEAPSDSKGAGRPERSLTVMLVDPDPGPQRQLLGLLSLRGHRVVPVMPEEAADLAHRLRFDAVFWAMRLSGPSGGTKWSEFQDRARESIGSFVLVSDGYDAELARSIEEGGNFLLGRPIQESELDRVLRQIDARAPLPARR